MWFIAIGVLAIALKLIGVAPVQGLSWIWVLSPFALAVVWWAWSDASGRTQRLEMDKLDQRKEERRQKAMAALGQQDPKSRRR
ncbi:TIGR04438 family Trp-rich protein [Pelomonas sp. SE-A7]|uniref:TIGR04438 family Trp-rich protein n=1 Tax=Pelomonas sp. SE-A7 TaxID=3054953 RepID=UPI00259CEEE4|nr:TIGR04438 family Trp-rich protein [Pelomonas sp. SE-A7]MDM4765655.1 TIGR04438 family Trp-rich protein [Pelomonas sp. SE-A7]